MTELSYCLACSENKVEINREGKELDFCTICLNMAGDGCDKCEKWSPGPFCFYKCGVSQ